MKKILFLFISIALFSCKKTELPTELRIKTARYFRNDSLIGQTDYSYKLSTGLLETETSHLNFGTYYAKHTYTFLNDSIQVDEDTYNGTDTSSNMIMVYVTGTKHLVSGITIVSKPFLIKTYERNYLYDGNDQLTQENYFTSKQVYDFTYTASSLTSYKALFPRLVFPFGTDTTQFDLTYTSKATQPGINFQLLINTFNIPEVFANSLNVELCGATFNTTNNLIYTSQYRTFGQVVAGGDPVTTYTYTFDNLGRVKAKSYKTENTIPSSTTYRIEYDYE